MPRFEYTNYYYHCGTEWEDCECDSMHNDHCPVCDKEIEPYMSKENATGEEIIHADLEELQKADRSTVLTLQLPASAAKKLMDGFKSKDPVLMKMLEEFKIEDIKEK